MDYMTLFPGYIRDKPRFAALAAAVLQQVNELMALVPALESGFSVQNGWDDETYRRILIRKLRRNQWNGLNESAFDCVVEGESFCDNGDGTVTAATAESVAANEVMPVPMGIKSV